MLNANDYSNLKLELDGLLVRRGQEQNLYIKIRQQIP